MRHAIRWTLALVACTALAASLSAQDKPKKAAPKAAPMDEKAMMEMWKKAATPGEMHKKMDDMVGTFDADVRMWMDPSKPPEDSKGTSVNTWVLGNRFVETRHEGTMMGEPFNGIGYTGYDNVQKKYVGTWMDNGGTGIMNSTCALDASGKSMTCKASFWDAMSGKPNTMELKTTWVDHDHHTMEMWGTHQPGGKKTKMMEITYTRKS
jgi:Protein of unknown function (DUF1579)